MRQSYLRSERRPLPTLDVCHDQRRARRLFRRSTCLAPEPVREAKHVVPPRTSAPALTGSPT